MRIEEGEFQVVIPEVRDAPYVYKTHTQQNGTVILGFIRENVKIQAVDSNGLMFSADLVPKFGADSPVDLSEQTIGEEAGWCDQSEEAETGMAEEPIDAQIHRLEGEKAKVDVIRLIMSYRNYTSDADKLRQIQQVID